MGMIKSIFIVSLLFILSSCKSDKEILCSDPIMTPGNLKIINRQCIIFNDSPTGFIELEDTTTKSHYIYTMNVVDDKVIFNLDTSQMYAISKANDAENMSSMAIGMSIGSSK